MNIILIVAMILLAGSSVADRVNVSRECHCNSTSDQIYQFNEKTIKGRTVRLLNFSNKVILIVNVASLATYYGFNNQDYELSALQEEYQKDLVILAFPCDQFGRVQPDGSESEVFNGIDYVKSDKDFVPQFKLFEKIDVNGIEELRLFTFLKNCCPATRDFFEPPSKLHYSPLRINDIRWNYEKFLVDRNGLPVRRYDASTRTDRIRQDIESIISSSP